MSIAVRIEPASGPPAEVEYRWDADTDILTASVRSNGVSEPPPAGTKSVESVEIVGSDGSWLVLDVAAGRIAGVEVAVWPDVRKLPTLAPPATATDGRALLQAQPSASAALEVDTALAADADERERTIHFRVGTARQTRAVRIARDVLLDLDARDRVAGVWLLNVPPFPSDAAVGGAGT